MHTMMDYPLTLLHILERAGNLFGNVEVGSQQPDRFRIVDDVLLPTLEKFRSQVKFGRTFIVRHCPAPAPAGFEDYEEWLKQATGRFGYPALSEQDGASMCFTSGTTGNPKGVMYS